MTSKDTPPSTSSSCSLGEAAARYFISLSPGDRLKAQQEVNKFVRWYGEERLLGGLTAIEVENYTGQITSSTTDPAEKLEPVKAFLGFAYKQGLTGTRLATHIKIKKASSKFHTSSGHRSLNTISMTAQGYADLETELAALKKERPRVADEIRKAAADKDFRENAPLEAAREYQGHLEGRIRDLESTLKLATVMDVEQADSRKVGIGDTVTLRDLASSEQMDYMLVDASEADPARGKLSIASPIGKALLGHEKGDEVEVSAPVGVLSYKIEDIRHN